MDSSKKKNDFSFIFLIRRGSIMHKCCTRLLSVTRLAIHVQSKERASKSMQSHNHPWVSWMHNVTAVKVDSNWWSSWEHRTKHGHGHVNAAHQHKLPKIESSLRGLFLIISSIRMYVFNESTCPAAVLAQCVTAQCVVNIIWRRYLAIPRIWAFLNRFSYRLLSASDDYDARRWAALFGVFADPFPVEYDDADLLGLCCCSYTMALDWVFVSL